MYSHQPFTRTSLVCQCDRCGKSIRQGSWAWSERLSIRFRAGLGSVFEQGNYVECDLCQECLRDVIGPWLRFTKPGPFPDCGAVAPYRACQYDQALRDIVDRLEWLQIAASLAEAAKLPDPPAVGDADQGGNHPEGT